MSEGQIVKTCGMCRHFVSWAAEYDDPGEDTDCGYCDIEYIGQKPVDWDQLACEKFEPKEEKA